MPITHKKVNKTKKVVRKGKKMSGGNRKVNRSRKIVRKSGKVGRSRKMVGGDYYRGTYVGPSMHPDAINERTARLEAKKRRQNRNAVKRQLLIYESLAKTSKSSAIRAAAEGIIKQAKKKSNLPEFSPSNLKAAYDTEKARRQEKYFPRLGQTPNYRQMYYSQNIPVVKTTKRKKRKKR